MAQLDQIEIKDANSPFFSIFDLQEEMMILKGCGYNCENTDFNSITHLFNKIDAIVRLNTLLWIEHLSGSFLSFEPRQHTSSLSSYMFISIKLEGSPARTHTRIKLK